MFRRKKKETQYSYDRRLQYLTMATFMVVMVLLGWMTGRIATKTTYPVIEMEDGWSVDFKSEHAEDKSLKDMNYGSMVRGERILYSNVLPSKEVPAACLYLRSTHCILTVYLNGEGIYSDGEQYADDLFTPTYYHYVPLPKGYASGQITIEMTGGDDSAKTRMNEVAVGNIDDIYTLYMQKLRFTGMVGIFLFMMGFVLIFVFLYMWIYRRFLLRVFCSAMISLILGIYMMTYYKVTNYLTDDPGITAYAEYAALFAVPIFVALMMTIIREGRARYFSGLMTCMDLIMFLAAVTLQYGGEYPMNRLVHVFHILIGSEGILLIIILFYGPVMRMRGRSEGLIEIMEPSERILAEGLFIMLISAIIEILRYNVLSTYNIFGDASANINLITLGALAFIVSLVIHVFYYHIEHSGMMEARANLEGLAYNDPLTNMANRGRFDQVLKEIERTGEPYTIISIDVDHLKEVNDTYGHAEGDRLLVSFADVMRKSFENAIVMGRVGGDEFTVVLKDTSVYETNDALKQLDFAMAEFNQEETRYKLEASYGAAFSNEKNGRMQEIIALADERMYQMKRLRKGKHAGRPERQVRHAS